MWLEITQYAIDNLGQELERYFLEKCIPRAITILDGKKPISRHEIGKSGEEQLIKKLSSLSDREFLSHLGFYYVNDENCMGFYHAVFPLL